MDVQLEWTYMYMCKQLTVSVIFLCWQVSDNVFWICISIHVLNIYMVSETMQTVIVHAYMMLYGWSTNRQVFCSNVYIDESMFVYKNPEM